MLILIHVYVLFHNCSFEINHKNLFEKLGFFIDFETRFYVVVEKLKYCHH